MALVVSAKIEAKLRLKHGITLDEVMQAFADRPDYVLEDEREEHKSDPPTWWFIASTDSGKLLKVVYIERDADVHLRTAYPANKTEIAIFRNAA
jgi:uncharacterized DUF497 family protein